MSTVDDLAALQEVELALARVAARLQEIQSLYAEPEPIIHGRAQSLRLHGELEDRRRLLRGLEDETTAVRNKRESGQKRLYSGAVTNPRELASLEAEAEALGRRLRQLEDQELELMLEIEAAGQAYHEATAELKSLEEEHTALRERLHHEEAELEQERARLEPQAEQQRSRLAEAVLTRYDSLKARKGGRAIGALRRGSCGACGVQVPTNVIQKADQRQELVPCPSCGRILAPE